MTWLEALGEIEDLEDAAFDAGLIADLERFGPRVTNRPIRFSTPTFKEYSSSELKGCSKNSFPAFSITAGECGLNCDHCQKKILEPMIPATHPSMLDEKGRQRIADGLPALDHRGRGALGDRELRQERCRGRKGLEADDPEVVGFGDHSGNLADRGAGYDLEPNTGQLG